MSDYRRRSLRALARRLDFAFHETDEKTNLSTPLQDFRLFQTGRNRTITNVLRQQQELMEHDLYVFDYAYQDWTGSQRRTPHHQTVFFVQSTRLVLPEVHLQPETLLHKLGELLGFSDIDFVRYPRFSGQYRLTGPDEVYIRHHFNDEVLNYFTLNKGWTLEGLGFYLAFYRKNLLLPTDQMEGFIARGRKIFELFAE